MACKSSLSILVIFMLTQACGKTVKQRGKLTSDGKGTSDLVRAVDGDDKKPDTTEPVLEVITQKPEPTKPLEGKTPKEKCEDLGLEWVGDVCVKQGGTEKAPNLPPRFVSTPVVSQVLHQEAGQSIVLRGKVRDFNSDHADFEKYTTVTPVLKQVHNVLGNDGNPIFIGTPGLTITRHDTFNQWFTDVPGVNKVTDFDLTLTKKAGTNIYHYRNDNFFPIDGRLFGNQGLPHNYHFTMRLETTFTYRGGEVFTFIGDDDVWVFIDNKLVVDLGGVHVSATGKVELDRLGLQAGKSYPFVMFFAERHTVLSQFQIETSVQLHSTKPYHYDAQAVDPEGDTLTYSLVSGPAGLSIHPQNGTVIWPPDRLQVGEHAVVLKVNDGEGGEAAQQFSIKVTLGQ